MLLMGDKTMGDKTILDSAEPRLESFYPPFVARIDLPQCVVDSYNLYQVGLWLTKCTRESSNGLGRPKSLISSLIAHLTSYISHERTRSRSDPKVRLNQVRSRYEKNCTQDSANGLNMSKSLISSSSVCLTNHASTRMNSAEIWSQGTPLPSWIAIGKNCTREMANGLVSTDGQTGRKSDSSIPPFNFVERG